METSIPHVCFPLIVVMADASFHSYDPSLSSQKPAMGFHPSFTSLVVYLFLFSSAASTVADDFLQCLAERSYSSMSHVVYAPDNSSYASILEFSAKNCRFTSSATRKPSFIITPLHESHIQATVICAKRQGFLLRLRSGGHDNEGLSSTAPKPFVMIDFIKLRDIDVDIRSNTAWVQAGATIGEVYYRIAEKSNTHGFPAGLCPTVGVGGHFAGGGLGYLWRKYGLAADNLLDIKFIDVNGKLHDRKSMGEDLFWALRGGGGNSFGVIVAWKLKLVHVPPVVTVFRVLRTLEQDGSTLFYKWQKIAHELPKDIYLGISAQPVQGENNPTIQLAFECTFQGTIEELLPLMENNFPELGLTAKDCTEMSWVESHVFQAHLSGPVEVLLNRSLPSISYAKGKYDFVEKAIPMAALERLWKKILEEDIIFMLGFEPMGGRMSEISETATPYPHRKGNIYAIQYVIEWQDDSASASNMEKSRRLYRYMTPYVSKSPRRSYVNSKDLDFGVNENANTPYNKAVVWGEHYFKYNFARLAMVKSKVDPENYFWDEQSIPPYAPTSNEIFEVPVEEKSYVQ